MSLKSSRDTVVYCCEFMDLERLKWPGQVAAFVLLSLCLANPRHSLAVYMNK